MAHVDGRSSESRTASRQAATESSHDCVGFTRAASSSAAEGNEYHPQKRARTEKNSTVGNSLPKRKVGRPRKNPEGGGVIIEFGSFVCY